MKEKWRERVLRASVMKRLGERMGEGWWRERGGRNQSASHYLLSGALQQRDEIIKNPIAVEREGMTEMGEIHIWTGQSKSKPILTCWHTYIGTNADSPRWPSHMKRKKVWVQQSKRKVKGRAGLEDELRVRGMWQEKWELKRNSRWSDTELGSLQSQSAESLAEAYQVFPSEWLRNCNKGWCTHINPVPPHERGRSRACFN